MAPGPCIYTPNWNYWGNSCALIVTLYPSSNWGIQPSTYPSNSVTVSTWTVPPLLVEDETNRHITVWGEHKRRFWKYLSFIAVKSDANPRPHRAFQTHTFKSIAKTIKIPLNREVRKEKLSTSRHYRRAVAAFMRG
jgi:hypothetical protein